MVKSFPELSKYLVIKPDNTKTINFSNPIAVKLLNKAILKLHYGIEFWDFPQNNLCPAVPGRANYIHTVADILKDENYKNSNVTCLDIGTGASCIFPIIGVVEYNWNFIASEFDRSSFDNAKKIIESNPSLKSKIKLRLQSNRDKFFQGVILKKDIIDITICNPPFHPSKIKASREAKRKSKNLNKVKKYKNTLNFSGKNTELIYPGGEFSFITKKAKEGLKYNQQIKWFTSMVSKEKNLQPIINEIKKMHPREINIHDISTSNKKSRILSWTFLTHSERRNYT